jgi:hypothetical protein
MPSFLEIVLVVAGIALIAFGIYGIVKGKYNAQATGGAGGATINIPLAGLLVILGLAALGFAAFLQATGGAKSQEGPAGSGPATTQPAQSPPTTSASISAASSPTPTASSPGHPITLNCSLSTGRIRVGMTLKLTYHVYLPAAREVGLGVGLYDEQGNDSSNGDGDVGSIALQPGLNSPSRLVTIPASLPAGKYELDAEVWPPNEIGQNGVNDLVDTQCATFVVP